MVESATFDGTNDYMARAALSGVSDSKTGILSAWVKPSTSGTHTFFYSHSTDLFSLAATTADKFQIIGIGNAGHITVSLTTAASTVTNSWTHILASWDINSATYNIYLNDAVSNDGTSGLFTEAMDYNNVTAAVVGALGAGTFKITSLMAEFYFAPGQYLDFSVTNNRRRFITSSLKPVYLGADGSAPTGTAPAVYLHLGPAETVANFATNRGTGGDFTITGALAAGSTSPSDF